MSERLVFLGTRVEATGGSKWEDFLAVKILLLRICEKRPLEAFLDRSTPLAEAALPRARRSRIDVPTPFASNARVTHSTKTMPLALAVSFRAPVGGAKKTQTKPIRRGGVVAPVAVLASDKCVALTAPNDARAISRRRARHARIPPASWSPVALSTRPRASPRRDADSARETWLRYHRFETPTADPPPARFDRNPTGARPTPRRSSPRSAPPSPVRDRHPPPHPASHEIDASFPFH